MTCPRHDELSAYADESMKPRERARFYQHLQTCPLCQQQLDALARRERGNTTGRVARAVALALRLELDAAGFVRIDAAQETSRPGIYAAGDLQTPGQAAVVAAAAGAFAPFAFAAARLFVACGIITAAALGFFGASRSGCGIIAGIGRSG